MYIQLSGEASHTNLSQGLNTSDAIRRRGTIFQFLKVNKTANETMKGKFKTKICRPYNSKC